MNKNDTWICEISRWYIRSVFWYWKENGEDFIRITFERPKEYGFDTFVIELPSYNVVLEEGNYFNEEKGKFMEIVKNGASFFFKYARLGGLDFI